jgi:hypothetical protein
MLTTRVAARLQVLNSRHPAPGARVLGAARHPSGRRALLARRDVLCGLGCRRPILPVRAGHSATAAAVGALRSGKFKYLLKSIAHPALKKTAPGCTHTNCKFGYSPCVYLWLQSTSYALLLHSWALCLLASAEVGPLSPTPVQCCAVLYCPAVFHA